MTLQQTIKSAVPRLLSYEIEALAVALEGAGANARGDELRLAFMHGAKWWEFYSTKGTMWQSDQKLVAEAAERRYHGGITEQTRNFPKLPLDNLTGLVYTDLSEGRDEND